MSEVRQAVISESAAQQCINNMERAVQSSGRKISSAQVDMIAHCLTKAGTTTTLAVKAKNQQAMAEEITQ